MAQAAGSAEMEQMRADMAAMKLSQEEMKLSQELAQKVSASVVLLFCVLRQRVTCFCRRRVLGTGRTAGQVALGSG